MPSYGHATANECPVVMFEGQTESVRIPTFSDTQSGVFGHLAVRSEVAKRPTCV